MEMKTKRGITEYSLWRLHRARSLTRIHDSTVVVDELTQAGRSPALAAEGIGEPIGTPPYCRVRAGFRSRAAERFRQISLCSTKPY